MKRLKGGLTRREFVTGVAATGLMAITPLGRAGQPGARADGQPNIVFIMADDMGYADAGCYGARHIRTPHIDSLAAAGVRLTQGYSNSAVCSPTRLALITGRYQYRYRFGLQEPGGMGELGLPPETPTLPGQLKQAGYRTVLVGKWHLGKAPQYGPLKSGYDRFFGIPLGAADYFRHSLFGPGYDTGNQLTEGEELIRKHGYLTDLLGKRAVQEIHEAAADKTPLFMSLHFTAPHWPWIGPEDEALSAQLTSTGHHDGGNLKTYARMVERMDHNIGLVLDALRQNGLSDNTIVVFTSDNGGERFSDNWPFIGGKTELLEGGIRVPLIVSWPARIPAGTVSKQVMVSMDFMPTLLAAAGGQPDPGSPMDGENLLPVLIGAAPVQVRTLFWKYRANRQRAVRDGDWKYLKITDSEYLFNLAEDQRERADLKHRFPDRLAELKTKFEEWDQTMEAYGPDSNSRTAAPDLADRYPAKS